MSGHSKWANIKHKKGRQDERRGKEFTRISKEIIIAVRSGGGGDPNNNPRLKALVQKAKAANMSNENIARAIKRGTGDAGEGSNIDEIIYEGYGPGGVAIMLEIETDNRNRTAADVRHLFSKYGGNLGETGCVGWMFKRMGMIVVDREELKLDGEEFLLAALEAGAEDVREDEDVFEVLTTPDSLMEVVEALESQKISVDEFQIAMVPENTVEITDADQAARILKLVGMLEDYEDIQEVYGNFTIPDDILDKIQ
ncbi:MAG: YebC/PmpR family DNA-binding transcriptional regulator [Methylocystaceae bacterium]